MNDSSMFLPDMHMYITNNVSYSASASQSAIAAPYSPFNLLLKYDETEN